MHLFLENGIQLLLILLLLSQGACLSPSALFCRIKHWMGFLMMLKMLESREGFMSTEFFKLKKYVLLHYFSMCVQGHKPTLLFCNLPAQV